MFDEAIKPSPRRPAQCSDSDTKARVVPTKVYQFANDESQDGAAHQPAGNTNHHKSLFRKDQSIAAVAAKGRGEKSAL